MPGGHLLCRQEDYKYIKDAYLRTYIKYFDVVKYIYGLDVTDESVVPGVSADRILFKREVLEPKRVTLPNGRKLHIYENKDKKYQFIDEAYLNGTGLSLYDLAFWLENQDKFVESYAYCDNIPATISIFGRTVFIPVKGLRVPRQGNVMLERYYAILSKLYKQIDGMLFERKKALAAKRRTRNSNSNSNPSSRSPDNDDNNDDDSEME